MVAAAAAAGAMKPQRSRWMKRLVFQYRRAAGVWRLLLLQINFVNGFKFIGIPTWKMRLFPTSSIGRRNEKRAKRRWGRLHR